MDKKVILITGATSGLGKAIAEQLLQDGHIVYGTSRNKMESTNSLKMLQMDITQRESIRNAISAIFTAESRIDVVINNAGMGIGGAAELATEQEIDLQMQANFYSVVNVCSEVLPIFRFARNGLIINVSSIGGVFALPYQGLYSASKFAVEGYSEALSLETKQFGIRVVVLEPGDFNTGFTKNRVISQATINSEYSQSFHKVLKNIEKDETNGGKPQYLAKKTSKIINKKHPKFRYIITPSVVQKMSIFASCILSGRAFQWIIRLFYGV
ncbi:MAG: SDR family oxidoreductase [Prevotellaceae bacterium]|jgi:short-subunit dehydrogenase|nr:SDR family oxidoreductase [Prevotellaceae bacterium]